LLTKEKKEILERKTIMPPNQTDIPMDPVNPNGEEVPTEIQQLQEQMRLMAEQMAGLAQQNRIPPQNAGASGQGMQSTNERLPVPYFKPPKPPPYSGINRDHNVINLWFTRMEQHFFWLGAGPAYQVQLAASFLTDRAYLWYRYYLKDWEAKAPNTFVPWETLKTALLEHFGEPNSTLKYWEKWRVLNQRTTVSTYNSEFLQLRMVLAIPDNVAFDKYIHGLKPKTMFEVVTRGATTVEEAMDIADKYDMLLRNFTPKFGKPSFGNRPFVKSKIGYRPNGSDIGREDDSRGTPMELDTLETQELLLNSVKFKGKCFNCGIEGHRKAECRKPPQQKGSGKSFAKNKKRQ
jgi:hypothetical protein